MSSQNLGSKLKRISSQIANTKFKRTQSVMERRGSRPQFQKLRRSGKVSGIFNGVATDGPQGPERKKFDNIGATTVNTGAPAVLSLTSGIAQGVTANNRIGDRIHLKAVDIELNITQALTAINQFGYMDAFLVWDKQPDGAVANANAIFQNITTNLTFGNQDNLERFIVLKRESFKFDFAYGLTATAKWHSTFDLATRFPTATGSPNTNDIYLCFLSPNAAAVGTSVLVNSIARITFTDE